IPEYFGRAAATRDYGAYDIEIVAEVNNAPRLAREAIRLEAEHYRVSGADLIDIGCTPGRAFPDLAAVIGDLVAAGMRVSMRSLERYTEARRRYPQAPLFMGIGNITELTAADTTGVHALLLAICQELGVRAVLTTEVIAWARGAVREIDVARRLMYHAVTQHTLPKGVDDRLVTVKDPQVLAYSEAELRELQRGVTDPNF